MYVAFKGLYIFKDIRILRPKILALFCLSSWTRFSLASSFFSWKYNVITATFLFQRYVRGLYIYFKACFLKFDRQKRFSFFLSKYSVIPAIFSVLPFIMLLIIFQTTTVYCGFGENQRLFPFPLSSVLKTIVVIWRFFSCAPEVNLRAKEVELRTGSWLISRIYRQIIKISIVFQNSSL